MGELDEVDDEVLLAKITRVLTAMPPEQLRTCAALVWCVSHGIITRNNAVPAVIPFRVAPQRRAL